MNHPNGDPTGPTKGSDPVRAKVLRAARWTASVAACFVLGALCVQPAWPMALGVATLAATVGIIGYFIVRRIFFRHPTLNPRPPRPPEP